MPVFRPEERVLIVAPQGQDAPAMAAMLQAEGISTLTCSDAGECARELVAGAGALLMTEEALELRSAPELLEALKAQPPWSELPLIILTTGGESRLAGLLDLAASSAGAITLLERPMSAATLLRSVQVALRSRGRQYQVRDLLLEQKQRQEQLRESEQRLRLAKSAAQLGIHDFYPITGELIWDERVRELLGVGPHEPPNYSLFLSRLHPDDRAPIQAAMDRALDPAGPGDFCAEYRVVHGQRTIWIAATGRVSFENGRAARLVGTVQDITERKEFQAKLERVVAERTARLQELVNELEHFSYSITHDMRAPLRAMAGFADMAAELCGASHAEEQRRLLQRISQSTARMDGLITDALSYSEAIRKHLPLAPVDANLLLRSMLDCYPEFQAAHANIQLQPGIPPVFANEAGLTQCFSNLLNNAINFTRPGQTPEIRIWGERVERGPEPSADPMAGPKPFRPSGFAPVPSLPAPVQDENHQNDWVRIWIEDHGVGISEAMLPRIFNMFSRGSTGHVGTGIGLALVRKVVDRMGGRVGVQSEEGKGARFWIELLSAERG